jgi:hypothetical protein
MSDEQHQRGLRDLVRLASLALLATAVVRELRMPASERTWHGRIGVIPYGLRPPTPSRVRAALWRPDEPGIIVPQPFGVGWSLNLGRLWRLVSDAIR